MRIGLTGGMCSGKSYVAGALVNNHGFQKFAFADKLKEIAFDLFDVRGKSPREREILQALGRKMREIDSEVWIKYLIKNIDTKYPSRRSDIVVDDVRYVNEIKALQREDFKIIRINTPNNIRLERVASLYPDTTEAALTDASEIEHLLVEPDAYLDSSSIEVYRVLDSLLKSLR